MSELVPLRQRANTALARSMIVPKRLIGGNLLSADGAFYELNRASADMQADGSIKVETIDDAGGSYASIRKTAQTIQGAIYRLSFESREGTHFARVNLHTSGYVGAGADTYDSTALTGIAFTKTVVTFEALAGIIFCDFRNGATAVLGANSFYRNIYLGRFGA